MAKKICFCNQKGGVAKTTTVLTVSKELARRGNRVLAIDLDPQATLTQICGVEQSRRQLTVQHLLGIGVEETRSFYEVVLHLEDIDLISSNILVNRADQFLVAMDNREIMLRDKLQKVEGDYDFILIDCPPNLGYIMKNGIMAADYIVIPTKPEVASIMGIEQLMETLIRLSNIYNRGFNIAGILFTMANSKTKAYREVDSFMQKVCKTFGTSVFNSTIRQSVACSDAVGVGKNIVEDENAPVAQDYKAFIDELLEIMDGK